MGIELNGLKDMSTVSVTASELCAIDAIIVGHIPNAEFQQHYNDLLHDIINTFQVVLDNLTPLTAIDNLQQFEVEFEARYRAYIACYLKEISRPRVNAECTYEKYLQFRKLKPVNTSFPLLKRSFSRLHDFIDKWLDNDIWLAMYIDSLFKMVARLLNDINEIASRDSEDAFIVFQSGLPLFIPYLQIINDSLQKIAARR